VTHLPHAYSIDWAERVPGECEFHQEYAKAAEVEQVCVKGQAQQNAELDEVREHLELLEVPGEVLIV
jgi:hypothetical protein